MSKKSIFELGEKCPELFLYLGAIVKWSGRFHCCYLNLILQLFCELGANAKKLGALPRLLLIPDVYT
jgi:hypothetical protein